MKRFIPNQSNGQTFSLYFREALISSIPPSALPQFPEFHQSKLSIPNYLHHVLFPSLSFPIILSLSLPQLSALHRFVSPDRPLSAPPHIPPLLLYHLNLESSICLYLLTPPKPDSPALCSDCVPLWIRNCWRLLGDQRGGGGEVSAVDFWPLK